jgi:beta-ribofuranosylaminobenzene 5'-phosphate synthase
MRGDLGRIHVSVGVAIKTPHILLKGRTSDELKANGPRKHRILEFAEKILGDAGIDEGVAFEMTSDIPEHAGFGSGTQLALAVGTIVTRLFDLPLSVEDLAFKLNRSRISGVGTHAFKHGGFIVDGGHRVDRRDSVPPLIFRSDVPEDWMFVVGLPELDHGLSGMIEGEAFKRLRPPSAELVGEVSRVVLVQMIPAIIEYNIESFGRAMTALDSNFGDYWLEVQGGRYSHPRIEEGVGFLLKAGVYGAGQSSWGPAFYGLVQGEEQAREISTALQRFLNSDGRRGEAFYTRPDNDGAKITVDDD